MALALHNIAIDQGATFQKLFRWRDGDGALVDLTGYLARMQVRNSFDSTTPLVDVDSAAKGGVQLQVGGLGEIAVTLTAAQTALLPRVAGVYDLELVSPTGTVTRLVQGRARIKPEVTR